MAAFACAADKGWGWVLTKYRFLPLGGERKQKLGPSGTDEGNITAVRAQSTLATAEFRLDPVSWLVDRSC